MEDEAKEIEELVFKRLKPIVPKQRLYIISTPRGERMYEIIEELYKKDDKEML